MQHEHIAIYLLEQDTDFSSVPHALLSTTLYLGELSSKESRGNFTIKMWEQIFCFATQGPAFSSVKWCCKWAADFVGKPCGGL